MKSQKKLEENVQTTYRKFLQGLSKYFPKELSKKCSVGQNPNKLPREMKKMLLEFLKALLEDFQKKKCLNSLDKHRSVMFIKWFKKRNPKRFAEYLRIFLPILLLQFSGDFCGSIYGILFRSFIRNFIGYSYDNFYENFISNSFPCIRLLLGHFVDSQISQIFFLHFFSNWLQN